MSFVDGAVTTWQSVGPAAQLGAPLSLGVGLVLGFVLGVLVGPSLRKVLRGPTTVVAPEPAAPSSPVGLNLAHTPRREIESELERSRRHNRSFAVIRLPGQVGPRPPGDAQGSRGRWNGIRPQVEQPLSLILRSIDRFCTDRRDVYLVLPETGRAGAERLVARIKAEVPGASTAESVRMVVFPEDGVTAGVLLEKLQVAPGPSVLRRERVVGSPVAPAGDRAAWSSHRARGARSLDAGEV